MQSMSDEFLAKVESIAELAEFWDTHDLTDFEDELEEVSQRVFLRDAASEWAAVRDVRVDVGLTSEEQSVGKHEELLKRILSGVADANIRIDDLRKLLERLGFDERVRGSHHIFRRAGILEKINILRDGNNAKPYPVRQVRTIILRYKLAGEL